jgi:hypothetical protein
VAGDQRRGRIDVDGVVAEHACGDPVALDERGRQHHGRQQRARAGRQRGADLVGGPGAVEQRIEPIRERRVEHLGDLRLQIPADAPIGPDRERRVDRPAGAPSGRRIGAECRPDRGGQIERTSDGHRAAQLQRLQRRLLQAPLQRGRREAALGVPGDEAVSVERERTAPRRLDGDRQGVPSRRRQAVAMQVGGAGQVRGAESEIVECERQLVSVNGQPCTLSPREFALPSCLVQGSGRVRTRKWLLEQVWGREQDGEDRAVDTCVMRLRERLGRDSEVARAIEAVRGLGYRLHPRGR